MDRAAAERNPWRAVEFIIIILLLPSFSFVLWGKEWMSIFNFIILIASKGRWMRWWDDDKIILWDPSHLTRLALARSRKDDEEEREDGAEEKSFGRGGGRGGVGCLWIF
jgi:hypothetical protein